MNHSILSLIFCCLFFNVDIRIWLLGSIRPSGKGIILEIRYFVPDLAHL